MSTPPNPTQTNPMMQQAQQAMNNPVGAPVSLGGGIDPSVHPVVGQIVRALQAAASGYGWTAMSPQEREQRTALQQQKAEALSRQAIAQQQLGLESQRVGFEGQKVGIEQQQATEAARHNVAQEALGGREAGARESEAATAAAGQKATEKYQTGELAARAKQLDQEADRISMEHQKMTAEYGPGGLRQQEVGIAQQRAGTESRMADIANERLDVERQNIERQYNQAGIAVSKESIEEEAKSLHQFLDSYYKEHPVSGWWEGESGQLGLHQKIEADKNAKIKALGQQYNVPAGTPSISGAMDTMRQATGGGAAPTPSSHQFSRKAWSAANPKGDVEGAARSAAAAGYQVTD